MGDKIVFVKPKFQDGMQSFTDREHFNRIINKGDVFPVKESVVQMLLETGKFEIAEGGK